MPLQLLATPSRKMRSGCVGSESVSVLVGMAWLAPPPQVGTLTATALLPPA